MLLGDWCCGERGDGGPTAHILGIWPASRVCFSHDDNTSLANAIEHTSQHRGYWRVVELRVQLLARHVFENPCAVTFPRRFSMDASVETP